MEGVISIVVNILLFGLKLWAGIVSGSLALKADAWHTLSDSVSSLMVIVGVRLSAQKPDRAHPYGHGRWEQITMLFIAFFLGIVAYSFLKDSILHLRDHETAHFGVIALVVTILSIIVKEALAQYAFFLYRKTGNGTLKADGWHHRTDALSSLVVLIGILLKDYFWWIDGVLGIAIALLLFYAVYEIAREAISKLLGEKCDNELLGEIREIVAREGGEKLNPHHFHMHNYSTHHELTFHITLDAQMTIAEGHRITDHIEAVILKELGIHTTIHIDPLTS